jgi:gliding motility-associated-like protein
VDAFLPPSAIVDTIMWDTEGTPFRCLDPECLSILLSPLNTITVSATAVGGVGCSDEDATRIIVRVNRDIFIPNVFSPNNDGVNDAFLPEAGRRVEIVNSMQIFDRWGNMMFESQDFMPGETSAGWDGTYRGKELDPGVFVYRVEATFDDGNTRIISGTVTLVR